MQNATDKNSELMVNTETASVQFFFFEVGLMAESLYVKLTQALGAFYSISKAEAGTTLTVRRNWRQHILDIKFSVQMNAKNF